MYKLIKKVTATDEEGNTYTKEAKYNKEENILSFGGFCMYDVDYLMKYYPFDKPFCIDIGGRNHKGIPNVCISSKEINNILKEIEMLYV